MTSMEEPAGTSKRPGEDASLRDDGAHSSSSSSSSWTAWKRRKMEDHDLQQAAAFVLRPPATAREIDLVCPGVQSALQAQLDEIQTMGYAAYKKRVEQSSTKHGEMTSTMERQEFLKMEQDSHEAAVVRGDPRDYQLALFHMAQKQNIIVNLDTGLGKTFIALLCIRHFVQKGKKTLFLVPSVALATQHTRTLQANLPKGYRVEKAAAMDGCKDMRDLVVDETPVNNSNQEETTESSQSKSISESVVSSSTSNYNNTTNSNGLFDRIRAANVIVATHGSANFLLMHYFGSVINLDEINLIVVDECHYAAGNHEYKVIFDKFYRKLAPSARPRVLGLTASPMVNVRPHFVDGKLEDSLSALESTLDSKLVSREALGLGEMDLEHGNEHQPQHQRVEEKSIVYCNHPTTTPIPSPDETILNKCRLRELKQFEALYTDLGPRVCAVYCSSVAREVSRNGYDQETSEQFQYFVKYLQNLALFFALLCKKCPYAGRTDKLLALEGLLEDLIENNKNHPTSSEEEDPALGIVFVKMRITALALYDYLGFRSEQVEAGQWVYAKNLRWDNASELNHHNLGQLPKPISTPNNSDMNEDTRQSRNGSSMNAKEDIIPEEGEIVEEGDSKEPLCPDNDENMHANGGIVCASPNTSSSARQPLTSDMSESPSSCSDSVSKQLATCSDEATIVHSNLQGAECIAVAKMHDDVPLVSDATAMDLEEKAATKSLICCDVLVRKATRVFRNVNMKHRFGSIEEENLVADRWIHQNKRTEVVLDKLRRKEVNVLLATSVIEEGVDVAACSFVVALDGLSTTKSYIQMKGRARRENAKFFVFKDSHPLTKTNSGLDLENAQKTSRRIRGFIETREGAVSEDTEDDASIESSGDPSETGCEEMEALKRREYRTSLACIDLSSSKSLLNRYLMGIKVDAQSRLFRESRILCMPSFGDNELTLPSHLPAHLRSVSLPKEYPPKNKSECNKMLALMACVRLHKLQLLNDRLLPLETNDMHERLLKVALTKLRKVENKLEYTKPPIGDGACTAYIYPILQASTNFAEHDKVVGGEGRKLGLITLDPLAEVDMPLLEFLHPNLGELRIKIGEKKTIHLTLAQWNECAHFFACLMSARWGRRRTQSSFRYNGKFDGVIPTHLIICLSEDHNVDWPRIKSVISDFSRDLEKRRACVKALTLDNDLLRPRLWTPIYDPHVTYICYGPSPLSCSASFPDEEYNTYSEYFGNKRLYPVSPGGRLFATQRLWHLPQSSIGSRRHSAEKKKISERTKEIHTLSDGERAPCDRLISVLLPQDACMETPISDVPLLLHSIMIPQVMYEVGRYQTVAAFLGHCRANLPILSSYLETVQFATVLEALTAKSCALDISYDRLEWFGDSVLKLIQTDTLLNSTELQQWITCLHEGDLTALRSAMGANDRLMHAAQNAGIDRFILRQAMGRGQWAPKCLDLWIKDDDGTKTFIPLDEELLSDKVCADLVEGILGVVYLEHGYEASFKVADELGLTLPGQVEDSGTSSAFGPARRREQQELVAMAENFLGKKTFSHPELLEEALTHSTAINQDVPSYQKLEWIGDAVLCLAAREWIYTHYPKLDVAELVVMEATLVSNETLAHLSIMNNLEKFIRHRDVTLPGRIREFIECIGNSERGLWGTDPPKVLSDVVEALLGAVHLDEGFRAGQEATICCLSPVLNNFQRELDCLTLEDEFLTRVRSMMHPTQVMYEMSDGLLSLRSLKEGVFAIENPDLPVWRGGSWSKADVNGGGCVAQVRCGCITIITVVESTSHIAKNRASSIAVACLQRHPEFMEKLRDPVRSLSKNIVDDDSDAEESDTEIKDQDANIVAEANGSSLVLSES